MHDVVLTVKYLGGFRGMSPGKREDTLILTQAGYELRCPRRMRRIAVRRDSWSGVVVTIAERSETDFHLAFITPTGTGRFALATRTSVSHLTAVLRNLMGRHPSGEAAEKAERDQIRTRSTLSGLLGQTPTGFEAAVAEILVANGYSSVAVRGGAGNLGVDISCRDSSGQSVAVQCKQYAESQQVTSQEMQLFIGMGKMEHQADRLIYATTGSYTQAASDLASKHGVELFDGQGLVQLAERMTR